MDYPYTIHNPAGDLVLQAVDSGDGGVAGAAEGGCLMKVYIAGKQTVMLVKRDGGEQDV